MSKRTKLFLMPLVAVAFMAFGTTTASTTTGAPAAVEPTECIGDSCNEGCTGGPYCFSYMHCINWDCDYTVDIVNCRFHIE